MKTRWGGSIVMAMWLVMAAGCATSPSAATQGGGADALIPCEEPRPEICTMDYSPVCGSLESGGRKTYSNGCSACSDHAVVGYTDGPCATGD